MKVITLCGSLKFKNEMMKLAIDIQLNGDVALTPVFPVDDKKYNKEELDNLSNAHRKKIELSDEILVVDVNGYIGESTKNEIDYACKLNKKIKYYSKNL